MNKFEEDASDHHQMLLVCVCGGGVPGLVDVCVWGWVGGGGNLPCHVAYPMMHLMLPTPPPPPNRQTPVKTLSTRNFVCGR